MNAYYTVPLSPPVSEGMVNWGLLPLVGSRDDYPLISAQCHYHLLDVGLRATLTHTFVSNAATASDVNYRFPLPPDASVNSFLATIGDRVINGVIREKGQAQTEYETAVLRGDNAALLQQENVEIFKLSLGNILPEQRVEVQISFVQTVTHEGGVADSLRLTFPLTIAPRYGAHPGGDPYRSTSVPMTGSTLEFSLSLEMAGQVTSLSSPTHPVSVTIGRLLPNTDAEFEGRHAHVALSSPALLEKDIVVVVGCQGLDRARCIVESFSPEEGAEEWTDAYALTFVPRFKLPELPAQEYIFLVDRSGSMGGGSGKMEAVRSALQIMLKSLPSSGTSFNIISFGSRQSTLWGHSEQYTEETVRAASLHVDKMTADHGGTEMKQSLSYAFRTRQTLDPTTVFVLTDGQSYDLDGVRDAIREYVDRAKGHASFLRVFCMGIGNAVSKAMCDIIARAGNGTAVYVGEREKPDQKLMGLLRAAAGPPIDDLELDWGIPENMPNSSDDDDYSVISSVSSDSSYSLPNSPTTLSLYEDDFNPYTPAHSRSQPVGPPQYGTTLPPVPRIQQAPRSRSLPSLFPGFRSNFYAIIRRSRRGNDMPARSVRITGNILGRPVALEVPVTPASPRRGARDKMVHLLAARAIVQSYEDMPAPRSIIDDAQIRRLGLRYGLSTSQTSFVAVDRAGQRFGVDLAREVNDSPSTWNQPSVQAQRLPTYPPAGGALFAAQAPPGGVLMQARATASQARHQLLSSNVPVTNALGSGRQPSATAPAAFSAFASQLSASPPQSPMPAQHHRRLSIPRQYMDGGLVSSPVDEYSPGKAFDHFVSGPQSQAPQRYASPGHPYHPMMAMQAPVASQGSNTHPLDALGLGSRTTTGPAGGLGPHRRPSRSSSGSSFNPAFSFSSRSFKKRSTDSSTGSASSIPSSQDTIDPITTPTTGDSAPSIESFARQQLFDGSFQKSETLVGLLFGKSPLPDLPADILELPAVTEQRETIWISLICLAYLDIQFSSERAVWEIMASKARGWLRKALQTYIDDGRDIDTLLGSLENLANNAYRRISESK